MPDYSNAVVLSMLIFPAPVHVLHSAARGLAPALAAVPLPASRRANARREIFRAAKQGPLSGNLSKLANVRDWRKADVHRSQNRNAAYASSV